MKILVTGATGFVGRELVKHLDCYRAVVREGDDHKFDDFHLIAGMGADTNWIGAFESVEAIIHLAGAAHNKSLSDATYNEVNREGTIELAKQASLAGVKRFVFVSSIGVNGDNSQNSRFTADSFCQPHNAYAKSKYDAEIGLKNIAAETGLEVVIVRPTLVYGPQAPGNFGLLTQLVKKMPVLPFAVINNKRDFISVQNLADLLVACATHPNAPGHTFLASDMETVSIKQFTDAMADALGKNVFQLPIPVSLMRLASKLIGKSAMVEQLVGNLQVDSSNITEVMGWTPPLTMRQALASLTRVDNFHKSGNQSR